MSLRTAQASTPTARLISRRWDLGSNPEDDGRHPNFVRSRNTTLQNLSRTGVGVFHAVDDVDLMARAALGRLEVAPVSRLDRSTERFWPVLASGGSSRSLICRQVPSSPLDAKRWSEVSDQPFRGFNRAEHAILEAAILATRVHLVPREQIEAELERLEVWVTKTAGPSQQATWSWLMDELRQRWRRLAERADESEPRSS
ncbi:MAG: DUF447 family protein [Pirellulaceae bacterium]